MSVQIFRADEEEIFEHMCSDVVELYGHSRGGCGTLSSWFKVAVQLSCTGQKHSADIDQASAQRIRLAHFLRRCGTKKAR